MRLSSRIAVAVMIIAACGGPPPSATTGGDSAPSTPPWPPTFEQYATDDTLTGPPAPLDYSANPEARRFRSRLSGRTEADFAGHLAFVVWGCGTECTSHMVLDLKTGRPYDDTLVNFSCGTVTYAKSSALVVWSGDTTLEGDEKCHLLPTRYFVWSGAGLSELPGPGRPPAPFLMGDGGLGIPLTRGDTLKLEGDLSDSDQYHRYRYIRHLPRLPFHLVQVHYYESIGYHLYHERTGALFRLRGVPSVSPHGTRIVAAAPTGATSETPNGLWVYQLHGDSLAQIWRYDDDDWGARDPVWAGEDTIRFTRTWRPVRERSGDELPAMLVFADGQWELSGEEPRAPEGAGPARIGGSDLVVAGVAYKDDSGAVRRRLGAPDSLAEEVWYYRDLTVYFRKTKVEQILLSTPKYATARGLRVGDEVSRAADLYGGPCASDALIYCHPADDDVFDERGMIVEHDGPRITGIRIGAVQEL